MRKIAKTPAPIYPKFTKASDVLKAAKRLIQLPNRWTTGYLAVNTEKKVCRTKSKHAAAFCALGAVKHVNGPAERSAIYFLRQAVPKVDPWSGLDSGIFHVNDNLGFKRTIKMFTEAIKRALKAGK